MLKQSNYNSAEILLGNNWLTACIKEKNETKLFARKKYFKKNLKLKWIIKCGLFKYNT
jgi:hypothetical protein